jgi:hypothetical protein
MFRSLNAFKRMINRERGFENFYKAVMLNVAAASYM